MPVSFLVSCGMSFRVTQIFMTSHACIHLESRLEGSIGLLESASITSSVTS